jgi:hypothetical protein
MRAVIPYFAFLLASFVPAQTYIVDVNGGPGTHFTSIAAAVAAVPDGAVIVVRPGTYTPFGVGNQSLKLLADPGVFVMSLYFPQISVSGLQATKSVVLSGFGVANPAGTGSVGVVLNACAGSVLLDRMIVAPPSSARLQVTNCDRVLVRGIGPNGNQMVGELTNSNTVMERCTFFAGLVGTPMTVTGGTLQLVDCSSMAGVPYPPIAPVAHAVHLQGGDLRLLGNTTLNAIAVTSSPTVGGSGTVRYDSTVVIAAPMFAPTIAATPIVMPTVTTTSVPGSATATVAGAPGHLVAVAVALPGPLVALPGLDAIWLDLATFTPLGVGVLGTSPFVAQMPWTPGAVPAVRAVFQALTFDPVAGFALSNPSFVLLP